MGKYFKYLVVLILIVVAYVNFFGSDDDDMIDEAENVDQKKITAPSRPDQFKTSVKNTDSSAPGKKLEVLEPGSLKQRRAKLEEKVENLKAKLEKCRSEVEEMVPEKELQQLEASVWDMDESKKSETISKGVENKILEKVGALTAVDWHMSDFKNVTTELMSEDLATNDPEWTLKVGAELRPCGLYNSHRLLSLWTEMVPPGSQNAGNSTFVEESVVNYVRSMLDNSIGAAGVAMQVELLGALADKGYFPPALRESIQELETRMNEEMDMKFENSDGNAKDLVRSIIADHKDTDRSRREVLDMMEQYFPKNNP